MDGSGNRSKLVVSIKGMKSSLVQFKTKIDTNVVAIF